MQVAWVGVRDASASKNTNSGFCRLFRHTHPPDICRCFYPDNGCNCWDGDCLEVCLCSKSCGPLTHMGVHGHEGCIFCQTNSAKQHASYLSFITQGISHRWKHYISTNIFGKITLRGGILMTTWGCFLATTRPNFQEGKNTFLFLTGRVYM